MAQKVTIRNFVKIHQTKKKTTGKEICSQIGMSEIGYSQTLKTGNLKVSRLGEILRLMNEKLVIKTSIGDFEIED